MNRITLHTLPPELKLPQLPVSEKPETGKVSFQETLKQFVNSVNDLQKQAAATETSFLKGEITDIHQVMIAVEEATVAFELLMEIRNKLLEGYQQIQRMPI